MKRLHRGIRVLAFVGLASGLLSWACVSAGGSEPHPQRARLPAPPAAADLSVRLARLLQDLDYDQSRRLSGGGAAESVYSRTSLGQVATLFSHQDQAVVILGKRGQNGEAQMDLESALIVSGGDSKAPAVKLDQQEPSRAAYELRGRPDGGWAGLLAALQAGEGTAQPASGLSRTQVTARQAVETLAKSRSAGFVFLLTKNTQTGQLAADKLIVVPDTVMISISGNGAPAKMGAPALPQVAAAASPPAPPNKESAARPPPSIDPEARREGMRARMEEMRARMEEERAAHPPPGPPMPRAPVMPPPENVDE